MKPLGGCLSVIVLVWFLFMGGCGLVCKWTEKQTRAMEAKP